MKARVRDHEALLGLQPREIAAYLRTHGWQKAHEVANQALIWTLPESDEDILLPLDKSFRDYSIRLAELVGVLEKVEQRPAPKIIRDLSTVFGDIIRFRVDRAEVSNGTIPLETGVRFFDGIKEIMASAASATVSPRPFFQSRRPAQASDFLQNARLGQTEQGSYVVTVVSKVPPELTSQITLDIIPPEEPFERQVVMTLARSLHAVRQAADAAATTGDMGQFQESVALGVSANLCEALANMGGAQSVNQIDVSFSWAPTRPVTDDSYELITFPQDTLPIIQEAGRILRAIAPREDIELTGVVTHLDREPSSEAGNVSIWGVVDDQVRRVHLKLSGADYNMALDAHKDRRLVRCRGDLRRDGKLYVLESPHGFTVERDTEP